MPYCMSDEDYEFLGKLNDGKDVNAQSRKDKLGQCSEDHFEEVMNFFEETSARVQPFANVDSAPILSFEEMERSIDDTVSSDAQKWFKLIYEYWESRKGTRPVMPSIKVRVLDTSTEVDDTDPYVCFRRREVRQTRKTRGRDNQAVEKLKKLRLELEQARQLVQMVVQREEMNKEDLEISRKVFEERKKLKDVKVSKNIVGEKGEDEELLVNQKVYSPPLTSNTVHPLIFSSLYRNPSQDKTLDVRLPSGFDQVAIALLQKTTFQRLSTSKQRRMPKSSAPSILGKSNTGDGTNNGLTRHGDLLRLHSTIMTRSLGGPLCSLQVLPIPLHLLPYLRRAHAITMRMWKCKTRRRLRKRMPLRVRHVSLTSFFTSPAHIPQMTSHILMSNVTLLRLVDYGTAEAGDVGSKHDERGRSHSSALEWYRILTAMMKARTSSQ